MVQYECRENRGVLVPRWISTIKKYWSSSETNIFKNYIDALCGSVVLIILPALSLVSAVMAYPTISSYTFPIVSVALAGAYDTYGRYEPKSPKNVKLGIRVVLDFVSIFLSALFVRSECLWVRLIAPIFLILAGITILVEVWQRVKTAIELSPWYLG